MTTSRRIPSLPHPYSGITSVQAAGASLAAMISIDTFDSFLSGVMLQVSLIASTATPSVSPPAPDAVASWLRPDPFGRVRLFGPLGAPIRSMQGSVRLPTGLAYGVYCDVTAPAGEVTHFLIEPVIRETHDKAVLLDDPGHTVEFKTSIRILTGIKVTSVSGVPAISG